MRRKRIRPTEKSKKRKRPKNDDNQKHKRIKRTLTREQKIDRINRFKPPNVGDLFTGLHDITKIPIKYQSHIPEKHGSNIDNLIEKYESDFIFRLLFYPEQLMYIAKQIKYKGSMEDPVLDEETNYIQIKLFRTFKKKIQAEMKFPKESDRKVSPEIIAVLSESITNHIIMSRSSYSFRYAILRLIQINEGVQNLVKQMVPLLKFNTLMFLLNNTMQTRYSIGIENQIHEENNTNIINDYVLTVSWAYPMNLGLFLEEGKEPIRLSNSIHKLK